jgi:hypothetical protein
LIRNTVGGTLMSVNKLTSSISRGISLISMDYKYLEERRRFMLNRADKLDEGIS